MSFIAAEYLQILPSVAIGAVALIVGAGRGEGTARTIWVALVLTMLVLRLVGPISRWWTVTSVVDDTGVTVTKGLISRRTRTMVWSRVRSIETTRPWNLRPFRLNRVTLIQAGEESAQLVLRAVPDGDPVLARLSTAGSAGVDGRVDEPLGASETVGAATENSAAEDERAEETTVHSLGRRDLIFVSLAYGHAVLLAPAVLMTAWEAVDTLGWADGLGETVAQLGVIAVGVAAVLGATLVGVVSTVVRFHGFRVSVLADDRLAIRYGLIEARERVVDPKAVVGVVVQRNVLERLIGRARLSVVTRDMSGGLGTSVIVPSVSLEVVDKLVRRHFDRFVTDDAEPARGRGTLVRSGASALVLVALPVLVFGLLRVVADWQVFWAAVLALGSLVLLRSVGMLVTARLHFDRSARLVVHTTRFSIERITVVTVSAMHGVAAVERPGGRSPGTLLLARCHLYTGQARKLTAPRVDRNELDDLRAAMVEQHTEDAADIDGEQQITETVGSDR